ANNAAAAAGDEAAAGEGAVAELHARRGETARTLEELRGRAREEDLERTELRVRGRILEERLREEWQAEPGDAVDRWGHRWEVEDPSRLSDPVERTAATDDETLARRRTKLERDLAAMGRFNPLAAQELDDLCEREDYLSGQLGDLRASRRDLFKVVASVDEEIRTVFGAAFAEVAREYEALFTVLFPGGQGRLRLTEPAELLATGVEVEARPGGKNLKRLSLLSGGERALAALSFLFAIFRARPSPFYVLDEVEAALDDINLQRFLRLLYAFRDTSQMLVVTHQKRTMEVADVLYGVSVRPDGASRVISQRLSDVPVALDGARGQVPTEG
ncbi:MAG: chromosome segregation protein SMC, partial [Actinomycetota bacterium]